MNCTTIRGLNHYLVLWKDQSLADDWWELVEHLTSCAERIAEYEAAAPRKPKARRAATWKAQARVGALSAPSIPPSLLFPPDRMVHRLVGAAASSTGGRRRAGNGAG